MLEVLFFTLKMALLMKKNRKKSKIMLMWRRLWRIELVSVSSKNKYNRKNNRSGRRKRVKMINLF